MSLAQLQPKLVSSLLLQLYRFTSTLAGLFPLHYFSLIALRKLFHSKYFTWTNLLTLLPVNYSTLFTSVEVLCFSHLQISIFMKSNNLNRLAGLSLAQLSPSLLLDIVQHCSCRRSTKIKETSWGWAVPSSDQLAY